MSSAATRIRSTREDDDFGQAGTLVREVMDDDGRDALVENIVGHASAEVSGETQDRVVAYWSNVDGEIGKRVASGLDRSEQAATPPQAEVPSNV